MARRSQYPGFSSTTSYSTCAGTVAWRKRHVTRITTIVVLSAGILVHATGGAHAQSATPPPDCGAAELGQAQRDAEAARRIIQSADAEEAAIGRLLLNAAHARRNAALELCGVSDSQEDPFADYASDKAKVDAGVDAGQEGYDLAKLALAHERLTAEVAILRWRLDELEQQMRAMEAGAASAKRQLPVKGSAFSRP